MSRHRRTYFKSGGYQLSGSIKHAVTALAQAIADDTILPRRTAATAAHSSGGATTRGSDRRAGAGGAGNRADHRAEGGSGGGTDARSGGGTRGDIHLIGVLSAGRQIAVVFLLVDSVHIDNRVGRAAGGEEHESKKGERAHCAAS